MGDRDDVIHRNRKSLAHLRNRKKRHTSEHSDARGGAVSNIVAETGRGQIIQTWVLGGSIPKQWEASRGCQAVRDCAWLMF